MSRDLNSLLVDVLNDTVMSPAVLVKFYLDEGDVCLWTGVGDLAYGGDTFAGVGDLLAFEFPEENNTSAVSGISISLSGIDSSWNSVALNTHYKGRRAELFLAQVTHAPNAVVGAPARLFKGALDIMTLDDEADTSVVTVTVERYSIDPAADGSLWDNEEQQRRFPGDRGLEYLPAMAEAELAWGVPTGSPGAPANQGTPSTPTTGGLGGQGRTNRAPSAPYTGDTGGLGGAGRTNRGTGSTSGSTGSTTGGGVTSGNSRGRFGRG